MAESPVHAVHDDDLPAVLEALGLTEAVARGTLRCKFSDDVITLNNLHSIFPDGGDIKLACDKPECIRALLLHLKQQNRR